MKRINKDVLKRIIIENREFIRDIPGVFVERECFRLPESIKKIVILYGVRRSGKTYLLYHLMKEHIENSMYIDFEDERLEGFSAEDFETLREAYYELFPALVQKKVYFLFDEIQLIDGWEKFCRRLVEKSHAEVVTAGSSSKIHPENISTTLRGRAWSIEVFPFSFKEFLAFHGLKVDEHFLYSDQRFQLVELFQRYLKWGGFPEVIAAANDFERQKIIDEYLDAIFFKDLVERYDISNITLLKTLKNKIFSSFSTKFSTMSFYNKVKGGFSFSKDLLYKYYQHLLDSKTVFEVRKYSDSEYKRSRGPSKVYIIDHCLAHKVAHDDSARALENIVLLELLRRGHKPHYFSRTNECDYIIGEDKKKQAIQVTYAIEAGNRERELNGLTEASGAIKSSEGLILTYNEEDQTSSDGIDIKVVPVWKWLLTS